MNEMKPEDVIKALECCVKSGYFIDCFLKDFEGISVDYILEAALALLHEKDAHIEHLEKTMRESILSNAELLENLNRLVDEKDAEIEKLKRKTNGEVEDDFPNCAISGCEAADAVCHLTCPYSKELADLKRDTIARLKDKGIDVYIYAMEYDEDGTPYFAFTFDKDKVAEAKEAWEEGCIIEGCYDEYAYGDFYEHRFHDMYHNILSRYEREKKK